MDKRLSALTRWISGNFEISDPDLRPASADASFRRYFRFNLGSDSYIAMDAPPEQENTGLFVRAAEQLLKIGLNVPKVIASDPDKGFAVLSDLGHTTYLDRLDSSTADELYREALGALVTLQMGTSVDPEFFPPYDMQRLRAEMDLLPVWYIERHCGYRLQPLQKTLLDSAFQSLAANALEQPQVWVHRDYHSRNLMVTASGQPGILDFQDAVNGPITYDLVSLLRDCYIEWPTDHVHNWALCYRDLELQAGLPIGEDENQFLTWFDLMGLQRHIKVLGIFARLYHRDGKSNYLNDLPLVWRYAVDISQRHAAFAPLAELLHEVPPPCTS